MRVGAKTKWGDCKVLKATNTHCEVVHLKAGEVLFEEEKEWRTFYVVLSGRLRKRLKITAKIVKFHRKS